MKVKPLFENVLPFPLSLSKFDKKDWWMLLALAVILVMGICLIIVTQYKQSLPAMNNSKIISDDAIHVYDDYVMINQSDIIKGHIQGTSMLPGIKAGDTLFYVPVTNETNLEIGDVIMYEYSSNQIYYNHRIIGIHSNLTLFDGEMIYVMRGDNNKLNDDFMVTRNLIKYKLVGVIY